MIITASPEEYCRPADVAISFPKFRENSMLLIFLSVLVKLSITS
jgi:hypothetical protein